MIAHCVFPGKGKRALLILSIIIVCCCNSFAGQPRNILWDGGFEIGYGNSCWAMIRGNYGPSFRSTWSDGVIRLDQHVASRIYRLEEGTYTLCAWVKKAPDAEDGEVGNVSILLTNFNYYRDKKKNQYNRKFKVPEGDEWHRIGWTFDVKGSVRPWFHLEIYPAEGVLLDAVSLTPGSEMPDKMRPAADIVAGFRIPEVTGIYVDGEERVVELAVHNQGPEKKAVVTWRIFDHREDLVREGVFEKTLQAGETATMRLPVEDLPHNGYRFACSVEGEKVMGDGLAAFLPRIPQRSFMEYGGDASINPVSKDFTARFMKRLGMSIGGTLSCGGCVGRWRGVEPEDNKYNWRDESVDAAIAQGIRVIGFLGLKYPPTWVQEKYMDKGKVIDEQGFIDAYCDYVEAFVKHYSGRINVIHLEDEISEAYGGLKKGSLLLRIYSAACARARQAAKDCGTEVSVGINSTRPEWWEEFLSRMEGKKIDFVSQNTNLRPWWTVDTLNILREKGVYMDYFYTMGVGQKSRMRKTSLILDRASSTGNPGGLFAWQYLTHAWLSRPYGTENIKDGPILRMAYYDLRVLGQCIYLPLAGKTGVEYDNSPTLGLQAMAMSRYFIDSRRPVRDCKAKYGLEGKPIGEGGLFLYPFRDLKTAVVVLMPVDAQGIDSQWRLTGVDFSAYRPVDIYGQPLSSSDDGSVTAMELPVFFRDIPAAGMRDAMDSLTAMKAERVQRSDRHRMEIGGYVLDIDPDREGVIRIFSQKDGKSLPLIDRVTGQPALDRPKVNVSETRVEARATLSFGNRRSLGIAVSEAGIAFRWQQDSVEKKKVGQTVRFRVSQQGAGRDTVIRQDGKVVSGKTREDYGAMTIGGNPEPEQVPANAARVSIEGFAEFDMSAATGRNEFSPPTGFKWVTRDGEAFLEADYTLGAYKGGGSRGVQRIKMSVDIVSE